MPVASVNEVFEQRLPKHFKDKPDVVEKVNASYKFVLGGDGGGTWIVDLTQPGGKITQGDAEAQCTISMLASDFVDLMNGKLNAQMAFLTGRLTVMGDIGMALKLQFVLA